MVSTGGDRPAGRAAADRGRELAGVRLKAVPATNEPWNDAEKVRREERKSPAQKRRREGRRSRGFTGELRPGRQGLDGERDHGTGMPKRNAAKVRSTTRSQECIQIRTGHKDGSKMAGDVPRRTADGGDEGSGVHTTSTPLDRSERLQRWGRCSGFKELANRTPGREGHGGGRNCGDGCRRRRI